jgi:hypothetical protein
MNSTPAAPDRRRHLLAMTTAVGAAAVAADAIEPRQARSQPAPRTFVLVHGA